MPPFPRDPAPDASLALLREGYDFPAGRYARLGTDAFDTRLMGWPATVARGSEATRMFSEDPDRFTRQGALPQTALRSVQDAHSVMALDGAMHRTRKAMFLALFGGDAPETIAAMVVARWRRMLPKWRAMRRIRLQPAARAILTDALCDWAGVPLDPTEWPRRAREFGAMVEGAGSVGPLNWRGLWLRRRTERWARAKVEAVRAGRLGAPHGSAVAVIARHRDADGRPLSLTAAGEELINCLRPSIACDRYATFVAHALHSFPATRPDPDDADAVAAFAEEVRRFYPFIPMMGGRALKGFEWRGRRFEAGAWVLLDLVGTDRDPRLWAGPDRFDPDRFARGDDAGAIVSHGGGDPAVTHRCPGEALTTALIRAFTRLLLTTPHRLPPQDLTIDPAFIPAVPRSRVVLELT